MSSSSAKNVLGEELQPCCQDPVTGYYRDGFCHTGSGDRGVHVVCAEMTEDFLKFTASQGNDLSTPKPSMNFPGLEPGDCWCLCAERWKEAKQAGVAPPVRLGSTHIYALEFLQLDDLKAHAIEEQT